MKWRKWGVLLFSLSLAKADGPPVPTVTPDPTPVSAPPAVANPVVPVPVVVPQVAPLPEITPVQLQFIAPDTVQEDLTGKVEDVFESSGTTDYRMVHFDRNGCYAAETRYGGGQKKEHRIWSYDAQGNFVSLQVETDPDLSGTVATNTYDAPHRKVTTVYKTADGTVKKTRVTSYDRFRKEHEVYEFDGSNDVTGHSVLNRDENGHETTVIFYNGAAKQPKSTITITWNPDGTEATESIALEDEGTTMDSTYTYVKDAHGNWHQLRASAAKGESPLPIGAQVLLVDRKADIFIAVSAPSDLVRSDDKSSTEQPS